MKKATNKYYASFIIPFVSLAAFVMCHTKPCAAQQYSIQSIGDFKPSAVNDNSDVAGTSSGPDGNSNNVIVWSWGSTTTIFPEGSYESVSATGINNVGQIVGSGYTNLSAPAPLPQSYVWDPNQGLITECVTDGQRANFSAINNSGQFAGQIVNETSGQAAIFSKMQAPALLPNYGDDTQSDALALNNNDEAAGWSGFPQSATSIQEEAVLWQNGTVIDLTPGNTWSKADGINDQGQVIGNMNESLNNGGLINVPFLWDAIKGLTELSDFGDGGYAESINDQGEIVGFVFNQDGTETLASLWVKGVLYNLNDLLPANSGWVLEDATGINDAGDIVGSGIYDGQDEAFLLTPDGAISIPEPAALAFGAGICSLFALRRQRR
ncbi:MAG TPA: DUF3466 family protein [Tepidisphaeraceae bacterium]|jgi:uncharacterized membrane protein